MEYKDCDPNKVVLVVGYPRSGNTWLARLLADALNSPFGRFGSALPIGMEGQDRPGGYFVTQLHLRPIESCESMGLLSPWRFNLNGWRGEKIVHILRDPRDVALSAMHYWDLPDVTTTMKYMQSGEGPFGMEENGGVGDWVSFNDSWIMQKGIPVIGTIYERLFEQTLLELSFLLRKIAPNDDAANEYIHIQDVVLRQRFTEKRAQIERDGDARPYGKDTQLKAMRRGMPGEWMEVFTAEEEDFACEAFGSFTKILGHYDLCRCEDEK